MARFFIDRPIFAWVLAIIVMLCGVVAVTTLPIAQYPAIAPPAIAITATYPGASAKTVEDTVTQVIEQKMKGLDRLSYIASTSDSSGSVTITLTFENGTNPDTAQVQVQNKLSLATPLLPQEVQQQGVQVNKAANNFLVVIAFISEDGRMTGGDLADYVAANVQDPLSRVPGVGDTQLFGSQHAMRIWLNPQQLDNFKLTTADVSNAVQAQNAQVSAGQLGGLPSVQGQQLNATITAQTRLKTAAEFEQIILRTQADGSVVRLRDVARIELGSESYGNVAHFNGKPATGLAIKLATGANALDTVKAVNAKLDELKAFYPHGMKAVVPYDTTPFVRISIEEVVKTLAEAIVLVFLVMYLFLQNFRATLIPTIAVPVVLLGTFGVLFAFGYSINTLTMFAMVLAIGLLVDDAIVVVENVERIMSEEGLGPKAATRKAMGQITGALVGITTVLTAVFIPMAFFSGSTGGIYRQFSLTIVAAMVLSVFLAMTLTPALCATMLKRADTTHRQDKGPLGWFNRMFERGTTRYRGTLGRIAGKPLRYMVVYVLIGAVVALLYLDLPSSYLPDEDQGYLIVSISTPVGTPASATHNVVQQVEDYFLHDEPNAAQLITVTGFSFNGQGQNNALAFVNLKNWSQRGGRDQQAAAVIARANRHFGASAANQLGCRSAQRHCLFQKSSFSLCRFCRSRIQRSYGKT